jgi:hypothetical protein
MAEGRRDVDPAAGLRFFQLPEAILCFYIIPDHVGCVFVEWKKYLFSSPEITALPGKFI